MASWFRWYHGCVSDPKLGVVARKCGQPKYLVIAVWAALLEMASQATERGDVAGFEADDFAEALGADTEAVQAVFGALCGKGLISENRVVAWDKRQFEGESAERTRRYRERKKHGETSPSVTGASPNVTETTDSEQNRAEQIQIGGVAAAPPPVKVRRAASLPESWQPSEALLVWAKAKAPGVDPDLETEKFRNHATANGRTAKNWDAAWKNWLLKADEMRANRPGYQQRGVPVSSGGNSPDDLWARRLSHYDRDRKSSTWFENIWGPAPDDPHCRVPKAILQQYGYGKGEAA
jgi:hypothetical protein